MCVLMPLLVACLMGFGISYFCWLADLSFVHSDNSKRETRGHSSTYETGTTVVTLTQIQKRNISIVKGRHKIKSRCNHN